MRLRTSRSYPEVAQDAGLREALAALKALADKVDATSECDHKRISCEDIGCIGAEVRRAREAIAKAEGKRLNTSEGICTKCSATQYCAEHEPPSAREPQLDPTDSVALDAQQHKPVASALPEQAQRAAQAQALREAAKIAQGIAEKYALGREARDGAIEVVEALEARAEQIEKGEQG